MCSVPLVAMVASCGHNVSPTNLGPPVRERRFRKGLSGRPVEYVISDWLNMFSIESDSDCLSFSISAKTSLSQVFLRRLLTIVHRGDEQ